MPFLVGSTRGWLQLPRLSHPGEPPPLWLPRLLGLRESTESSGTLFPLSRAHSSTDPSSAGENANQVWSTDFYITIDRKLGVAAYQLGNTSSRTITEVKQH